LNRSSSCTHHRPRTCVTGFGMAWRAQTSPCFPGRHQKTGRSSSARSPDEAVCAAKRPCCLFLHLPLSKRDVGGVHIPHPLVLVQVEPMEIRLTYASTVGAEERGKGSSDAGSELEEPFRVYRRDRTVGTQTRASGQGSRGDAGVGWRGWTESRTDGCCRRTRPRHGRRWS
jgi:hypothetical protein